MLLQFTYELRTSIFTHTYLQKNVLPLSKFKLGTYPTVFSNISFQHCWHIFKIYNDQTLHRVLIVVFLGKLFKFMQVIFSKKVFHLKLE